MSALALRQGTPEWIEGRRLGIGSSDAPVIAGESPYRSVIELWAEKTSRVPAPEPDADTARLFRIGHLMEPLLLTLHGEATGRKTRRVPGMLRHRSRPWMTASLDGRVVGERRIVECKWTNSRRWGSGDDVPGDVLVQVQHAMEVAGADVADVVALVGPSLRIVEVPRDDAFIADLVALETDFWRHVTEGTEPAPDGSESAHRTLTRLHPVDDGTLIEPTPDLLELVDSLRAAKAAATAAKDAEQTIGNAIRAIVGDASGVDGLLTYRKNADSTRTNWPAVATAYRDVLDRIAAWEFLTGEGPGTDWYEGLETRDAIVSIHSETKPGPRVLLLSKEPKA